MNTEMKKRRLGNHGPEVSAIGFGCMGLNSACLITEIAVRKNATPAQIALAWLLARKPFIVPIPGTTKLHRPEENTGAVNVTLSSADLSEIEAALGKITISDDLYPEESERRTNL